MSNQTNQNTKIVAIITVKPEFRATLLPIFQDLVGKSRAESGNIRYDLHQDIQNENRFVFVENWRGQPAIDSHNASEHFQNFVKSIDGKIDGLEIVLMNDISENND